MAYDAHLAQDLGGLADQPSYPAKPVTPATLCTAMTYNIIMYILYSQIALHAALPDSTAYGDYREDSGGKRLCTCCTCVLHTKRYIHTYFELVAEQAVQELDAIPY